MKEERATEKTGGEGGEGVDMGERFRQGGEIRGFAGAA